MPEKNENEKFATVSVSMPSSLITELHELAQAEGVDFSTEVVNKIRKGMK